MADMIDLAAQTAALLRGARSSGSADIAQAEVVGKDDEGNAIVDLGQGQRTVAAQGVGTSVGDTVPVLLDGHGGAMVISNVSDPPSAAAVRQLGERLEDVQDQTMAAREIAKEAADAAGVEDAHVWDDEGGTHVADVGREEWAAAEADGFSDLSPTKQYHNILMNYLGILLRSALTNLVSITRSAIAFFDGIGNVVARFGSDGAQVGLETSGHVVLDDDGMEVMTDSSTSVAAFGRTTRVGSADESHMELDDQGIEIYGNAVSNVLGSLLMFRLGGYAESGFSIAGGHQFPSPPLPYDVDTGIPVKFIKELYLNDSGNLVEGVDYTMSGETVTFLPTEGRTNLYSYRIEYDMSLPIISAGISNEVKHGCAFAFGSYLTSGRGDQVLFGRNNDIESASEYSLIIGNGTSKYNRSNAFAVRWNGLTDVAGRTAHPLFVYDSKPAETDAPVTPCFVYDTSDGGLYHYSG